MTPSRAHLGRIGALALASALVIAPAAPAIAAGSADAPAAPTAAQAASTITPSATSFEQNQTLTVEYATDAPHELNWIGVYAKGQEPGGPASTRWDYAPDASGSIDLALDIAPGAYEIWFLAQDGYEKLAGPVEIEVTAPADAPQAGDPDAPVEIDPVATEGTDETISRTAFGPEGADGWEISAGEDVEVAADGGWRFTDRAAWTADIDGMRDRFARSAGSFAVADAEQFGGSLDTTLRSAPVDVAGLGSIALDFESHYRGAAGQSGVVTASFDGGEPVEVLRLDEATVESGYDALQMNGHQQAIVEVPAGASEVVFSWRFTADDGGRYWAIDEVAVRQVATAADGGATEAWVMSDIQGHPQDWQHALGDYAGLAPDADGMLIVGDIVNSGAEWEWDEIYDVMDATADVRPQQTIASLGNHERYAPGGFAANRDRFLQFAERDRVWDEYVLDGAGGEVPVIVLGQEFGSPSDVAMSDAQVEFLEERLAHWSEQDKQVIVMTHFPLGETVSASWIPWYSNHHMMNDRLTSILGNYPNAVVFAGHTHYPAEQGDWAMQRRTADGHADGFWAVNTLAMHVEWDAVGESTDGITEVTTGDINRGLTVDTYADRMVVKAWDFASDEQLREVTIPNPLVASAVDLAPAPEETPEPEAPAPEQPGDEPGTEEPGSAAPSGGEQPSVDERDAEQVAGDEDLVASGGDATSAILWIGAGLLAAGGATALLVRHRARRA